MPAIVESSHPDDSSSRARAVRHIRSGNHRGLRSHNAGTPGRGAVVTGG